MIRITEKGIIKNNFELHEKIISYPININLNNFTQKYYNYINNLIEIPKCLECDNECNFIGNLKSGYYKYCSTKCVANSNLVKNKISNTCKKKYGVTKFNNREKAKQTNIKKSQYVGKLFLVCCLLSYEFK